MYSMTSIKCLGLVLVLGFVMSSVASHGNTTRTPIKLATLLQPPLVMKDERTGEYYGFFIEALDKMGYNVTHVNTIIDDKYGLEDHPRKVADVLKDVAEGKSDLAIVAPDSENRKFPGVTFTQPLFNLGFMGLHKTPKQWTLSYNAMMTMIEPFSPGLWCMILLMCVLASGVLFLLRGLSPFEARTTQESTTPVRSSSFIYMFASLWGQSPTEAPRSFSARLLACVWWVFSLMTSGAYVAGLLAILLRMNPHVSTLPFGSIDEMIQQTEVEVLAIRDSATYNYFNRNGYFNSSGPWKIWKQHLDTVLLDSMDAAMEKLNEGDGKYIILIQEVTALYVANSLPCDKMVAIEPTGDLYYGFACRKDDPLCEDLDRAIIQLRESGRIEKLEIRWTEKGCRKGSEYSHEGRPFIDTFGVGDPNWLSPISMTIRRFSGAFVMLMIGFGAAFLVLFAEILYIRWRGKPFSIPSRGHNDLQGIIRQDQDSTTPHM